MIAAHAHREVRVTGNQADNRKARKMEYLIFPWFVFWIAFSVIVGVFANQRRNRSGFGWFLLSLLMSPLLAGLFVAAMREKDEQPRTPILAKLGWLCVIIAAIGFAFILWPFGAHAAEMPKALTGQWCQVANHVASDGSKYDDFIRAKNFCRADRPEAYDIQSVGFWIKLADVKHRIMCVPLKVKTWRLQWTVTAACGADDNSTPVYQVEFMFELGATADKAIIARQ